ncbi:hypothetical protein PD5205_01905 [Xanthomonas fragariae]|uniref:Uncharacterized protein n=1 Tax=Xanthomonas fragariae TaxID=48664 RepID=A0A1Y6HI84_9XANT|nr:hypothetical protein PD5205_01905 [Xanthomonas fragariae]
MRPNSIGSSHSPHPSDDDYSSSEESTRPQRTQERTARLNVQSDGILADLPTRRGSNSPRHTNLTHARASTLPGIYENQANSGSIVQGQFIEAANHLQRLYLQPLAVPPEAEDMGHPEPTLTASYSVHPSDDDYSSSEESTRPQRTQERTNRLNAQADRILADLPTQRGSNSPRHTNLTHARASTLLDIYRNRADAGSITQLQFIEAANYLRDLSRLPEAASDAGSSTQRQFIEAPHYLRNLPRLPEAASNAGSITQRQFIEAPHYLRNLSRLPEAFSDSDADSDADSYRYPYRYPYADPYADSDSDSDIDRPYDPWMYR